MDYSFHPAAEAELNDAIDYYESIQPGHIIFILAVMNLHREPDYWENRQ